jgi:large subunit ribosomal protein L16
MALMPKRVKFRKWQRGKIKGVASKGNYVAYGEYGLQSLDTGFVTGRQIEAGRVAATHYLHRQGKVYIRIFPHRSISSKPLETRMGKGKGEPNYWAARIKPGTILYEVGGIPEDVAREALLRVCHKMPVKCRFVVRKHAG